MSMAPLGGRDSNVINGNIYGLGFSTQALKWAIILSLTSRKNGEEGGVIDKTEKMFFFCHIVWDWDSYGARFHGLAANFLHCSVHNWICPLGLPNIPVACKDSYRSHLNPFRVLLQPTDTGGSILSVWTQPIQAHWSVYLLNTLPFHWSLLVH